MVNAQPTGEVWVQFEDVTGQVAAERVVTPQFPFENVLEFHTGNWNVPQQIRLSAVNDAFKEGPHQAIDDDVAEDTHFGTIIHAVTDSDGDSRFPMTLAIDSLMATIADDDDDVAGLSFMPDPPSTAMSSPATSSAEAIAVAANVAAASSASSPAATLSEGVLSPPEGPYIELSEGGGDATYWVVLDSKPQADVTEPAVWWQPTLVEQTITVSPLLSCTTGS